MTHMPCSNTVEARKARVDRLQCLEDDMSAIGMVLVRAGFRSPGGVNVAPDVQALADAFAVAQKGNGGQPVAPFALSGQS